MHFKEFSEPVKQQFDKMTKGKQLYEVDVDRDILWNLYLASFPEGSNPIYKEKAWHDCNCCKNFIRDVGNVVIIENGKLVTIWDVKVEGAYAEVAKAMSEFVKQQTIVNVFQHRESKAGVAVTRQKLEDGTVIDWNHFHCDIPGSYVRSGEEKRAKIKSTVDVFKRGLREITLEAIEIVEELIEQNSLYKGDEYKAHVSNFKNLKKKYDSLKTDISENIFLWENFDEKGARIKNTVIGTLLLDISEGVELDRAVKSFEDKIAPTNYKRPKAVVTKGMIEQAMKTIEELGIEESLYRRFAVAEDLTINNVLYADRSTASVMKNSLKDVLMKEVKESNKDYSKIEEISIEDFIQNILPNVSNMEVLFENKHKNNLVSLIAPKNEDAPNIFKWYNKFSWSYNGNTTDSIKERVKNAGGNVEGVLRTSLSWGNTDDYDLHVMEPNKNIIHFANKRNMISTGFLDVDMNVHGDRTDPVENIAWTDKKKMQRGKYIVSVNNFTYRNDKDYGFQIQTECNGEIVNYSYTSKLKHKETVQVLEFEWDGEKMINVKPGKGVSSSALSQEVWKIETEKFHKVNILTISPNHWDEQEIGHKHFFFILEGCLNDDEPRGFYNEFLKGEFEKHRKVFEMIGGKTKCPMSDRQLSGLGFSSTKRDEVICKVGGSFNRTLKIKF